MRSIQIVILQVKLGQHRGIDVGLNTERRGKKRKTTLKKTKQAKFKKRKITLGDKFLDLISNYKTADHNSIFKVSVFKKK